MNLSTNDDDATIEEKINVEVTGKRKRNHIKPLRYRSSSAEMIKLSKYYDF